MYIVYSLQSDIKNALPVGYTVKYENISGLSSVHSFLWSLFKGSGVYQKYYLEKNGVPVCSAEVIEKCPFLRFLPKNGIHIGPCYTLPEHRGNGYYPLLIKYIASSFPKRTCIMFVHESNKPSIRGIEKAGFKIIGTCNKYLFFYH